MQSQNTPPLSLTVSLQLLKLFKSLSQSQTFSKAVKRPESMGINNHQKLPTPIQLISSSHFLKFVTKILLPFSVLSVVLSYPLLCNFHILAHGLQLLRFSVGKNYIFLLCIGLLVFIAISSGLLGSCSVETEFKAKDTPKSKGSTKREFRVESSEQKVSITNAKVIPDVDQESQESKMESPAPPVQGTKDVLLVVQDEDDQEERQELVAVESSEQKGSITKAKVIPDVDQESQELKMESPAASVQRGKDVPFVVQDEDDQEERQEFVAVEEDEDEGLGSMSKEELNKKCEEFIRKMKEEIQFEARLLVMVQ